MYIALFSLMYGCSCIKVCYKSASMMQYWEAPLWWCNARSLHDVAVSEKIIQWVKKFSIASFRWCNAEFCCCILRQTQKVTLLHAPERFSVVEDTIRRSIGLLLNGILALHSGCSLLHCLLARKNNETDTMYNNHDRSMDWETEHGPDLCKAPYAQRFSNANIEPAVFLVTKR